MMWELPVSLTVGGEERRIRSDFRDILTILSAFDDPDLRPEEKVYVCLSVLFEDFFSMPPELYEEAYRSAMDFIDNGIEVEDGSVRITDWEQDAPLIFPAVNRAAGCEVRSLSYLHWHTFMGYFMEIRGSVYASVLNIRRKKAKNKKLEKQEEEFLRANRSICVLRPRLSEQERLEKEKLRALLGE